MVTTFSAEGGGRESCFTTYVHGPYSTGSSSTTSSMGVFAIFPSSAPPFVANAAIPGFDLRAEVDSLRTRTEQLRGPKGQTEDGELVI